MHKLDPGAARQRGGCGRSRWDTVFPGGSRAVLLAAGAVLAGGAAHPAYGQANADDSVNVWNADEIWKLDTSDCDKAFQTCMETTEPVTQNVTVTLYWCDADGGGNLPSYVPVEGVDCIAKQHIETIYHHQFGTCLAKFYQCIAKKEPRVCELTYSAGRRWSGDDGTSYWSGVRRGSGEACTCELQRSSRGWVDSDTDEACNAEISPRG